MGNTFATVRRDVDLHFHVGRIAVEQFRCVMLGTDFGAIKVSDYPESEPHYIRTYGDACTAFSKEMTGVCANVSC